MRKINQYISEKLRINDNTKLAEDDTNLNPGNKMFAISIRNLVSGDAMELRPYSVWTFKSFYGGKIRYKTNAGKDISLNAFINSNGFIEFTKTGSVTGIFMPVSWGLKCIEDLCVNFEDAYNETPRNKFYKYFDRDDEWIDDVKIKLDDRVDVDEIIKDLKQNL